MLEPGYLKYKTPHVSSAITKKSDFIVKMSGGYEETITVTEKDDMVGTFSPFNWTNMSALIDTALCTVKTFKYQSEVDI